tara:strand:+ start:218 stop:1096 length:879 start_codon:yes stop_codon:yes gene_type:complete
MHSGIKASVIIVTFDRLNILLDLLNDFKNQTYSYFEVILISDGCCSAFHHKVLNFRNFFKLVSKDTGLKNSYGLAYARNMGIRESDGDYCILIDDDCKVSNDFIESHIKHAERKTIIGGKRFSEGEGSHILVNKMNELLNLPNKSLPISRIKKNYKKVSLIENNISFYKKDIEHLGCFFDLINSYGLIGQEFFYRASFFNFKYKFVEHAAIQHLTNAKEVKTNPRRKKIPIAVMNNIFILPLLRNRFYCLFQKNIVPKLNYKLRNIMGILIYLNAILVAPIFLIKRILKKFI